MSRGFSMRPDARQLVESLPPGLRHGRRVAPAHLIAAQYYCEARVELELAAGEAITPERGEGRRDRRHKLETPSSWVVSVLVVIEPIRLRNGVLYDVRVYNVREHFEVYRIVVDGVPEKPEEATYSKRLLEAVELRVYEEEAVIITKRA